jgi:hypothetical protein
MCLSIALGVENYLGDTAPVPKINKYETSVIPTPLNPAHEDNAGANIVSTESATIVSTLPITERVQSHKMPFFKPN